MPLNVFKKKCLINLALIATFNAYAIEDFSKPDTLLDRSQRLKTPYLNELSSNLNRELAPPNIDLAITDSSPTNVVPSTFRTHVRYWSGYSYLDNIQATFSDSLDNVITETAPDENGLITLTDPNDNVSLSLTRTETISADARVITSADALAALKIAVGISPNSTGPASAFQMYAADYNGDGRVTSADALAILKKAVGITDAIQPDWVFVDANSDLGEVTKSNIPSTGNQFKINDNGDSFYHAVLRGDVNGSLSTYLGANSFENADYDGDGLINATDEDDDNDGIADTQDLYPYDKNHFEDHDQNGHPDPIAEITLSNDPIAGQSTTLSSKYTNNTYTYDWSLLTPSESFSELSTQSLPAVDFEPDSASNFVIKLTVSDKYGSSAPKELVVTPELPEANQLSDFPATQPPSLTLQDQQDAIRFLYQATFGPRVDDVEHLMAIDYEAWFAEQLTFTPSLYVDAWRKIADEFGDIDGTPDANGVQLTHESFMLNAMHSPDQLRQRMTYALSQLFVISERFAFSHHDQLVLNYVDTLHTSAFGNFRDLMQNVTLHPAMGLFLAMLGNQKADPELNIRPDENYARELMQLFTVGLNLLNQNGTSILDESNEPIQTYSQKDIQNYAAALTGWYFADLEPYRFGNTIHSVPFENRIPPMQSYDDYHQKTQKKLLGNYYIPAGASAEESLKITLDSLFYHPNLAPFVARHLIKNFTTSNPSADYIARVAAVFNANENGERGNLASVLKAVLLDQDARSKETMVDETFGRVKDPLLKYVNHRRFLNYSSYNGSYGYLGDRPSQTFLNAPSVFNFYSPTHTPSRAFADKMLVSPELQIITSESIVGDAWLYGYPNTKETFDAWSSNAPEEHRKFWQVYDLSHLEEVLFEEGLSGLIDFLNTYMAQGRLNEAFKTVLIDTYGNSFNWAMEQYNNDPSVPTKASIHDMLGVIIYHIVISPEYSVQH